MHHVSLVQVAITVVQVTNVSDTAICHCTCPSCSYIDTNSNIIDEKLKAAVTKSSNIDNMYVYLEDEVDQICTIFLVVLMVALIQTL